MRNFERPFKSQLLPVKRTINLYEESLQYLPLNCVLFDRRHTKRYSFKVEVIFIDFVILVSLVRGHLPLPLAELDLTER